MPSRRSKLLASERRREIATIIRRDGRAIVGELVKRFGVSAVTLRADLRRLAEEGILIRSYGGAVLPQESALQFDSPLNIKKAQHHAEKVRIANAALRLIQPHQTILLDSGTTSAELARAIKRAKLEPLTVITHAINIAEEFLNHPQVSVIMPGGVLRHVSASLVGPQAEKFLSQLHADHFFLGIDGFDTELHLSTPDLLEAQLNKIMMRISTEVTVIADASKLGRRSLSVISDVSGVHRLITGPRANEHLLKKIRHAGIEVVIA